MYALETMPKYFDKILDKTGLMENNRIWLFIFLEVLFAVSAALVIEAIRILFLPVNEKFKEKNKKEISFNGGSNT